ncbi:hypothetical protein D3C81_1674230 [compost metagenome]
MAAHGVGHQVHLAQLQGLDEGLQTLGLGADIVAAGGPVAVAEARQVKGYDVVALGEVPGETQPVVLVGAETVDHQDGFTPGRAALVVMNAKIAQRDLALRQTGELAFHQDYARRQRGGGEIEGCRRSRQEDDDCDEELLHDPSLSRMVLLAACTLA